MTPIHIRKSLSNQALLKVCRHWEQKSCPESILTSSVSLTSSLPQHSQVSVPVSSAAISSIEFCLTSLLSCSCNCDILSLSETNCDSIACLAVISVSNCRWSSVTCLLTALKFRSLSNLDSVSDSIRSCPSLRLVLYWLALSWASASTFSSRVRYSCILSSSSERSVEICFSVLTSIPAIVCLVSVSTFSCCAVTISSYNGIGVVTRLRLHFGFSPGLNLSGIRFQLRYLKC